MRPTGVTILPPPVLEASNILYRNPTKRKSTMMYLKFTRSHLIISPDVLAAQFTFAYHLGAPIYRAPDGTPLISPFGIRGFTILPLRVPASISFHFTNFSSA